MLIISVTSGHEHEVINLCIVPESSVFDPSLKFGQRSKNGTFVRERLIGNRI